jgi:hypothetical protein
MDLQEVRQRVAELLDEIRLIQTMNAEYSEDRTRGSSGKSDYQNRHERLQQIKQELQRLMKKPPEPDTLQRR